MSKSELTTVQSQAPSTPMHLIEMAVGSNADPDKLEKLMELQERWEAGNARKQFFEAMARFQSECPDIPKRGEVKDKYGKHLYYYPKLEDIIKTIRGVERTHGFRHRWDQEDRDDGSVCIVCEITHVGGHSERSTVTIPATKGMNTNTAQDRGIIIKYGKRYSLLNAYGLEPDDDTDANMPSAVEYLTNAQVYELEEMLDRCEQADPGYKNKFMDWFQTAVKVDNFGACPANRYKTIRDALAKKLAGGAK